MLQDAGYAHTHLPLIVFSVSSVSTLCRCVYIPIYPVNLICFIMLSVIF